MTDVLDALIQNTFFVVLIIVVIGFAFGVSGWVARTRWQDDQYKERRKKRRGFVTKRRTMGYYNVAPKAEEPKMKRTTYIEKRGDWVVRYDLDKQKLMYINSKTKKKTYVKPKDIKEIA